jgi:hypothetical protein
MPDDHYQSEKLIIKSLQSYKGLIPSINFKDYEYSLYLQYASPEELEQDIVSEKTYLKIVYEGNWDDETTNFSQARMRYF